jgi:hypothetical protein
VSFLRHGKSIDPMRAAKTPEQELCLPRRPSASMSFSWLFLGGLLSSRARLRFTNLRAACDTRLLPVENFSANGKQCLIRVSQPRGPLHGSARTQHPFK